MLRGFAVAVAIALAFVGLVPFAAQAKPSQSDCSSLFQVADTLRLARPAQVAQYHAGLSEACRNRLMAEGQIVVETKERFSLHDGEIWIPSMAECGCGGDSGAMNSGNNFGGGNEAPNLDRGVQSVGQTMQAAGSMIAGVGAATKNGAVLAAGAIIGGIGAALNAIGGSSGGGNGSGNGTGRDAGDGNK